MKSKMRLSLKAGERVFINGAVLSVDQKVTITLLNDARFLLESYVLQMDEAITPMRQLYFVIQALLISPQDADKTMQAFRGLYEAAAQNQQDGETRGRLEAVRELVEAERTFDALKTLRTMFEPLNRRSEMLPAVHAEHAA